MARDDFDTTYESEFEEVKQDNDALLNALLSAEDEVTKNIEMPRFGGTFTVRAISSDEYTKLEKRCKYPVKHILFPLPLQSLLRQRDFIMPRQKRKTRSKLKNTCANVQRFRNLLSSRKTNLKQMNKEEIIMVDITPIINAVIALLTAVLSVFFIPWLKSRTTEQQRKELSAWVKIGVAAAEQLYKGSGRGEEKKQYVLDFLSKNGLVFDEQSILAMIEAAVLQLKSSGLPID